REDGRSRAATASVAWGDGWREKALAGVVVPSPLLLGAFAGGTRPQALLRVGAARSYPEALARTAEEFWPALLLAQALAAALAALCHLRQRRYGAAGAERVAWPLFVLALGLPGWVGYRFGRAWPALARCGDCGRAVPLDRESCARCAADFPRPALAGT